MITARCSGAGMSRLIGRYAGAVRMLWGSPGLRPDGRRPDDFAEEARQAWCTVGEALECVGAKAMDIVQVRSWLINADDVATGVHVGKELIVDKPTSMLAVVPQLIRSDVRLEIEIEIVAAVAPGSATTGQDA
jgi:enamine deaminase RidA (YjgF/YER057c/UK114 family)